MPPRARMNLLMDRDDSDQPGDDFAHDRAVD